MSKFGGTPKCPTCGKAVYFAEQVLALNKPWHKQCLKCKQCSKSLSPGQFSDNNGNIYCKSCYASVIGLKGFGHGVSLESHRSGGAEGRVEFAKTGVIEEASAIHGPGSQNNSNNFRND
eukprot:TRINITY_DN1835_c0_g1_i1.p1 TRINITY_DN1835_c0_g1~~TRINITY_DN1835_c0_g1_i1.p1  ORF type:complete len:119 (-),score=14.65 TRINITY_DN1835_c0_g1_i1:47-403(-)